MRENAILITGGKFEKNSAKTALGLLKKSDRYNILAVIDYNFLGQDTGKIIDGEEVSIPIYKTIKYFLQSQGTKKNKTLEDCGRGVYAIIGIATPGGVIPHNLRVELLEALSFGMHIVNGLHHYLSDDTEIVKFANQNSSKLIDIRKPKRAKDYSFWTGEILKVRAPRIAIFGTDCSVGKRTTAIWLRDACRNHGICTEMIYTGQTGKLQGGRYGFILDSTLNDFVSGELESEIIRCDREENPDLILLEGQSSLRNPSGPCGSEYLCSALAKGVIMQYAPKQKFYLTDGDRGLWPIPPIEEEIELIRLYGAQTLALTLNSSNISKMELHAEKKSLSERLGLPVVCPREEGLDELVPLVKEFIKRQTSINL